MGCAGNWRQLPDQYGPDGVNESISTEVIRLSMGIWVKCYWQCYTGGQTR